MDFLAISRKKPELGDVFTFKHKYLGWGYGKVIMIGAMKAMVSPPGVSTNRDSKKAEDFLVYIYNHFTKELEKDPKVDKNDLAIPPQFINRQGWLKGFFKTIQKKPLKKDDMLEVHCFKSMTGPKADQYVYTDENRNVLPMKIEPCGFYAMGHYKHIDYELSKKFNLPLSDFSKKVENEK